MNIRGTSVDRFVAVTKVFIRAIATEMAVDYETARGLWIESSAKLTGFEKALWLMGGDEAGRKWANERLKKAN